MKDPSKLIDLTKDLIRIPSTHSRPEKIRDCSDWIESWLQQNAINYRLLEHNGVPSILVLPKEEHASVVLVSHFDVVEAENCTLFTPQERNGKLYGRGAIDDKYGVALSLTLFNNHLNALRTQGRYQEDMDFGLLFTGDEELGGANGTGKVIDYFTTDFVIALDGGHPDQLITREKGSILLELTATGKSAHAARPWLGENAFDLISRDYLRIQELFKATNQDQWHKTIALTQCSAGNISTNMIPGSATALFDIRYTENDDPEKLIALIDRATTSSVEVKALEPVFSCGKSPYLDSLIDCAGGVSVGYEHGASDARYFSSRGIPGVVWGADGEMSQHTEDEHLVISSLFEVYHGLDRFLSRLPQ